jgi:hypothetical protein
MTCCAPSERHHSIVSGREAVAMTVKQQLPGGDGGQRQRRGLGEVQRRRLAADDALVDQLELRVAAGTGDVAGVVDLVAGREQGHLVADRLDHAGGVVAEHARRIFLLRLGCAHLGIDRVDRDRFHPHQDVVAGRFGLGQFDVLQGLRVVDGQVAGKADGFHGGLRLRRGFGRMIQTGSGLRSANCPRQ